MIEDESWLLESLAQFLEVSGFEVHMSTTGKSGLYKLGVLPIDLIVCDVNLPDLNGCEIFETVKGNDSTSKIPFIFITAYSRYDEVYSPYFERADSILFKPFSPFDLVKEINKF